MSRYFEKQRTERNASQRALFHGEPVKSSQAALKCMSPEQLQAYVLGLLWGIGQCYREDWEILSQQLTPQYPGVARLLAQAAVERAHCRELGIWNPSSFCNPHWLIPPGR